MKFDICAVFIIPSIVLIAGVLLRIKIPPINSFYGYRTRRSSKNKDNWIFANKLASILMIILSLVLMLVGSILLICKYIFNLNIEFIWFFIIVPIILCAIPVLVTEVSLKIKNKNDEDK